MGEGCWYFYRVGVVVLVRDWTVEDTTCYLRNEQLNPLFSVISFKGDGYVDWSVPCINYRPKCYYGRLWSFIWYLAPISVGARCSSVVRAFAHGAMGRWIDPSEENPLSYFSFQPVFHDWCNKGRGMCYPVCGMVHIKEPLLLIGKSSLCGGSGFPFSLTEWSLTLFLTPYNRK